ncbi:MAG TPA: hypothetical protein VG755_08700, partial [Nannocystaceae bacterium]|nr:hypothetical protein [Nannocystaceae bacterium]
AAVAMLRLSARELAAALADPSLRRKSPGREVLGMRAKAWLGVAQLRELDRLVRAIEALLSESVTRRPSTRPFAVSVVLAPTDRPRRRRKSS